MTNRTSSSYKLNNQLILREHPDEIYQPTEEEIHEYALYIGIDLVEESDLLWLAREGFMKALPPGWKPCQDERGELYYFNFDTGKSSWEHPYDQVYKKRVIQEREKKQSSQMNSVDHLLDKSNPTLNRSNRTSNIESSPNENQSQLDRSTNKRIPPSINEQKIDFEATIEESDDPMPFVVHLSDETSDLTKFRQRIEKSTDDEKLALLEEHRLTIEEFKRNLRLEQEKEEDLLRERMKTELISMENQMRETIRKEKKNIEMRQQNCQREKETNRQILAIEIKYEYEERIRLLENRYKKEIDELIHQYEQMKLDKENIEKRFKEKSELCSNLQRTIDEFHQEKFSINDNSHQYSRQISTDLSEEDSQKKFFHSIDDDDDERLSETDSDVIEMKQTLKEFEHNQLQSTLTKIPPIPTDSINFNQKKNSFDRFSSSSSLFDSGHWTTTTMNTSMMNKNLKPLLSSSNPYWSPSKVSSSLQSSLITREAVLKAARDVLPPGVLDHLTLNI